MRDILEESLMLTGRHCRYGCHRLAQPLPWQVATMTAVRSGADDYVQGLARLGIAKLPGHEVPKIGAPAVAAHSK